MAGFIMKLSGGESEVKQNMEMYCGASHIDFKTSPSWLHCPSQSGPRSLPNRGTWHWLLEAKEGLLSRSPCWFLCCLSPTAELSGCNTLSLERKDPRVASVCLGQYSCPLVPVTLGLTVYHVTCLWKAVFIKMTSVRWLSSQSNTI